MIGVTVPNRPATYSPSEVDFVDMDRRADWAETDTEDPSFILNKPSIPTVTATGVPAAPAKASAAKSYLLTISSTGVASWTELPSPPAKGSSDATYVLKVASTGALSWVAET